MLWTAERNSKPMQWQEATQLVVFYSVSSLSKAGFVETIFARKSLKRQVVRYVDGVK